MTKQGLKFLLISPLLFISAQGFADPCPTSGSDLRERTAVCDCDFDVDPTCDPDEHYKGGRLCIVDPAPDANINDSALCITGKFKTYQDVQSIADFVTAVSHPDDPSTVPDQVAQPAFDAIEADGNFAILVPILQEGNFQAIIHADFFVAGADPIQRVPEVRNFTRIGQPDFTVSAARETNVSSQPNYTTTELDDSDGDGIPNNQDTDFDNDGQTNDVDPDDDNDAICDDIVTVPGICTAGEHPDPIPTHAVSVTAEGISGGISASNIDLCVTPPPGEVSTAGTDLTFTVENEITDTGAPYEKVLTNTSTPTATRDTTFCPGGLVLKVPLGHGENRLEITIDNAATTGSGGQKISLGPIRNDIQGPQLCVDYLTPSGELIRDSQGRRLEIDGQVLPASLGLTSVQVDVTSCGSEPEAIAPQRRRRNWGDAACDNDSICFQQNHQTLEGGVPLIIPMQKVLVAGLPHYRAFVDPRFAVNVYTITARDLAGNVTQETHSFGFGQVRSLVDAQGEFTPATAAIPRAISAFIPARYVTGELKRILLHLLNTDKFTTDLLPKLLEPHQLDDEVIQELQGDSGCAQAFPPDQARAIRLFNPTIESVEISGVKLLDGNKLQLTLQINNLESEAEIFSIKFIDTDGDGRPDTDDEDADDDQICDRYEAGSDLCHLDQEINFDDCPDVEEQRIAQDDYLGCSDQDDDGDSHLDNHDFPGALTTDPVFLTKILPVRLTVEELAVHLQLRVLREDNRLKFEILNIPEEHLVQGCGIEGRNGRHLVQFECDRDELSQTYFDGYRHYIKQDECRHLADLNNAASGSGQDRNCLNQSLDDQLLFTLERTLYRQIPHQLKTGMEKLRNERLTQLKLDMFDHTLGFDLFSNLSAAEIKIDHSGASILLPALLAPAGVRDVDSDEPLNAHRFIEQTLDPTIVANNFGPLIDPEREPVDPTIEAENFGGEANIGTSEPFLNSLLHSANTLLYQLSFDKPDLLDLSATKLREMGLAAPNPGGGNCVDKNDTNILADGTEPDGSDDDPNNNWKCFLKTLDIGTILGTDPLVLLPGLTAATPVVIRTQLNPRAPITLKIVDVTPFTTHAQENGIHSSEITATVELGLRDAEMALYEGKFEGDKIEPQDWCLRQPQVHPDCLTPLDQRQPLPMAVFKSSGKLTLKMTLLIEEGLVTLKGGIASLRDFQESESPDENGYGPAPQQILDIQKSYLDFSLVQNNTLIRDRDDPEVGTNKGILSTFQGNIGSLLSDYLANSPRAIWMNLPLDFPPSDFCAAHPEINEICKCLVRKNRNLEECESVLDAEQSFNEGSLKNDFEIKAFLLDDLTIGMTGSPQLEETLGETVESLSGAPRHLLMGLSACIKGNDGGCIEATQPSEESKTTCERLWDQ